MGCVLTKLMALEAPPPGLCSSPVATRADTVSWLMADIDEPEPERLRSSDEAASASSAAATDNAIRTYMGALVDALSGSKRSRSSSRISDRSRSDRSSKPGTAPTNRQSVTLEPPG